MRYYQTSVSCLRALNGILVKNLTPQVHAVSDVYLSINFFLFNSLLTSLATALRVIGSERKGKLNEREEVGGAKVIRELSIIKAFHEVIKVRSFIKSSGSSLK